MEPRNFLSDEKTEQENEILRLLITGDKEIEIGKGYDLDAVLAEADADRIG